MGNISDIVEACGKTRVELNKVHWHRMHVIQRTYAKLFGISIKVPAGLNQFYHYKGGGYPRENSPPRYADAADKLANMYLGADYIDEAHIINNYLSRTYGLKLVRTKPAPALKMRKITNELRGKFKVANIEHLLGITDPKKMFRALLEEMNDTQTTICQMSDSIKYAGYARAVKRVGNLRKSSFMRVVGAKATSIKSTLKGKIKKRETLEDATLLHDTVEDCI